MKQERKHFSVHVYVKRKHDEAREKTLCVLVNVKGKHDEAREKSL